MATILDDSAVRCSQSAREKTQLIDLLLPNVLGNARPVIVAKQWEIFTERCYREAISGPELLSDPVDEGVRVIETANQNDYFLPVSSLPTAAVNTGRFLGLEQLAQSREDGLAEDVKSLEPAHLVRTTLCATTLPTEVIPNQITAI
ncbi:hypothetical protein MBLNU457_7830t1 [Dothideomycetes sp. NU457]